MPRSRVRAIIASSSGWSSGSPPLNVIMEVPSAASRSSRLSMSGSGTGFDTASNSLQ